MGSTAVRVSTTPGRGWGAVVFLDDGRVPWVTSCPVGSYPVSNNTDRSVALCEPCPPGFACLQESRLDPYTLRFGTPESYYVPHLAGCGGGKGETMHVVGAGPTSVGQCVQLMRVQ